MKTFAARLAVVLFGAVVLCVLSSSAFGQSPDPFCNGVQYSPKTRGCCDGTLYARAASGCCNGVIYNSVTRVCLNGKIQIKPRPTLPPIATAKPTFTPTPGPSCGGMAYNPNVEGCCNGTIYSPKTRGCCDGTLYARVASGCCDGTIYNSLTKMCVNGHIQNLPLKPRPTRPPIATAKPTFSPTPGPSCGGMAYNPKVEGCCGGNIYSLKTRGCCGGTLYGLGAEGCCGDHTIYRLTTQGCSGGKIYNSLKPTPRRCKPYNTRTHACCGGTVVPHSATQADCCGGIIISLFTQMCDNGEVRLASFNWAYHNCWYDCVMAQANAYGRCAAYLPDNDPAYKKCCGEATNRYDSCDKECEELYPDPS